jgi:putative sterol carrier protein
MEVFTGQWCTACCEQLNASEAYRNAAADWEGSVVLLMTADPAQGIDADRAVFIDLHHGACRGSRVANRADLASAAYVFQAGPAAWKRLLSGADPVATAMTGALKLARGNLFALARYAAAAREMVAAAGEAGGTFPPPRG